MIRTTDRWSLKTRFKPGSDELADLVERYNQSPDSRMGIGVLLLDDQIVGKSPWYNVILIAQFEVPKGFLLLFDNCSGETFDPFMNIPLIRGYSDICVALYSHEGRLIECWTWLEAWTRPTRPWSMTDLRSKRPSALETYYIIDDHRIALKQRAGAWVVIDLHDFPRKVRGSGLKRHLCMAREEIDPSDKLQYADQSAFISKKVSHLRFTYSRRLVLQKQYWWSSFRGWGFVFWPLWPFTDSIPAHVKKYEEPFLKTQPLPPPLRAYDGPLSSKGLPWGFELWWTAKKDQLKRLFGRDKS